METTSSEPPMKKRKQRCSFCSKPSIVVIECSGCAQLFCLVHRLAETHQCQNMDHFKNQKLELIRCVPVKINKV